jgi:hypothetical protein
MFVKERGGGALFWQFGTKRLLANFVRGGGPSFGSLFI